MQAVFAISVFAISVNIILAANRCRKGQYTVIETDATFIACRNCPECGDDYGNIVPCNTRIYRDDFAHADCRICIPGKTYSDQNSVEQCKPCKSTMCLRNEIVIGKCTRGSDTTRCNSTCVHGYYWSSNSTERCQPIHRDIKKVDANTTTTNQMSNAEGQSSAELPVGAIIGIVAVVIFIIVVLIVALTCYCKKYKGCSWDKIPLKYMRCKQSDPESADGMNVVIAVEVPSERKMEEPPIHNNNCGQESEPSTSSEVERFSVENNDRIAVAGASTSLDVRSTPSFIHEEVRNSDEDVEPNDEVDSVIENLLNPAETLINSSLSTPDGTPTSDRKARAQPDLRRGILLKKQKLQATTSNDRQECVDMEEPPLQNNNCAQESESSISSDRMTKKPSQLNAVVYRTVCSKLNQIMEGKDYKEMAGRMGCTHDQVNNFTSRDDPAAALLSSWETKDGHDVKKLMEYLRAMGRNDVVELLVNQDPCYP